MLSFVVTDILFFYIYNLLAELNYKRFMFKKLCIRYWSIKSLVTFNLLNINNMHKFLNINLL